MIFQSHNLDNLKDEEIAKYLDFRLLEENITEGLNFAAITKEDRFQGCNVGNLDNQLFKKISLPFYQYAEFNHFDELNLYFLSDCFKLDKNTHLIIGVNYEKLFLIPENSSSHVILVEDINYQDRIFEVIIPEKETFRSSLTFESIKNSFLKAWIIIRKGDTIV